LLLRRARPSAFSGDPVGAGLVASLARPGGNTTGLSSIAPELSRVALLGTEATLKQIVSDMRTAGDALGVQISPTTVRGSRDLDEAFVTMKRLQAGGVIVASSLADDLGPQRVCRRRRPHDIRTELSGIVLPSRWLLEPVTVDPKAINWVRQARLST
jgi:hypothetical protein